MKNLLLLEWQKLRWPVMATLIFLSLTVSVLTSTLYKSYSLEHDLEAWEIGINFIVLLFPLISVIPVCWLMYFERKDQFLMYTVPRVSKSRYLASKWIVVVSSSFLIMFVSMAIGVITALYIKPDIIPVYSLVDNATGKTIPRLELQHFMGSLFVHHPLVYGLLLSFWQGILAAIIATFGFILSLYINNIFVILTGPFIYAMLENFILSMLGFEGYRLYISFNPESFNAEKFGYFPLLVGPLLALLFTALIAYFYSKVKRSTVYPS
ncbi:hypothetical protein [Paenibacillus sanguinis]|uniref:hypothetical protein n=1 Tax=Paenibacillus sanguinis TaxID=225906 RepID=UPI00037DB24B|nr:hypothetical protein [Paenibacillus sanguinis]